VEGVGALPWDFDKSNSMRLSYYAPKVQGADFLNESIVGKLFFPATIRRADLACQFCVKVTNITVKVWISDELTK
jgi:hypothetical protein